MSKGAEIYDLHLHSSKSWLFNRTHISGTHVPVEEPSTASKADISCSEARKATSLAVALSRIRHRSAKAIRFKDLSLTLIEVTCAGVTELPSVEDARHC